MELLTDDDTMVTLDNEKASIFNTFFHDSVRDMRVCIPQNDNDDINMFRTMSPVSSRFVLEATEKAKIDHFLDCLEINKSPGCDNITPKMLLVRKAAVSEEITNIFNKMIEEMRYPNVLKVHKIMPIPKGIRSNKVENYRPISVLSIVDKILEKVLFEQLSSYLEINNILFDRQFGFKKGTGTEEAVVNVVEYVCSGLDAGFKGVAGVFFDLSKAFDLVDHDILVKKLDFIGFSQNAVELFKDYLRNRRQFVQVGESKSGMLDVLCGVPQGSVLGPLLFKIYINDLKNIKFYGKLFMFADDICLLYNYKHEKVLQTQIEYDASILSEFLRINKLILNSGKTKFIKFKPYISRNDEVMSVHIGDNLINESESVKYLGINLCHNLIWEKHINQLKSKISSGIGILYKFRNKLNPETKILLYNSLIHSHLTYLPMIYASKSSSVIKSLQSAQNKALKIVFNLPLRYSTVNLFKNFAKTILPIRGLYKQQILIYVFKCIKGYGFHNIQFHQNLIHSQRITRHATDLNVARCRLEMTKQRVTFAGANEYNQLPENLKNIFILSTFKGSIKQYLLNNVEILLTN